MKSALFHRALAGAFALTFGHLLAAEPATFPEAVAQGKFSANVRPRYEGVEQTGLQDAEAFTVRTRVGFTTAAFKGFKGSFEFEDVTALDGDSYSQAGINPGGAGKAVIADPEGTEINQAWLSYTTGKTTGLIGRQRLVLDNARFVGDVAWRQNMQTFDGFVLQDKSVSKLTLNYAYLYRIDRVFGKDHPQGRWDSDSHVFNASYSGFKAGTLTGYAYLLDFSNAAAQSNATYGVSFAGATPLGETLKATYRAEVATQSDYGSSKLSYTTDYYVLEAGVTAKLGGISLGYEVLGSDGGLSFRTPLATLHAFNGWADLFLNTPVNGLRDSYIKVTGNLPQKISFLGFYHSFEADRLGADYGTELDLQLTRKFGSYFTGTLKYAKFERDSLAFPDVTKFWAQVDFTY